MKKINKKREFRKRFALLLCICLLFEMIPTSIANAEKQKSERKLNVQAIDYATSSNQLTDSMLASKSDTFSLVTEKKGEGLDVIEKADSLNPIAELISGELKLDGSYYFNISCIGKGTLKAEKDVYIKHLLVSNEVVIDAGSHTVHINDFTWVSGKVTIKGKVEFEGNILDVEQQNYNLVIDNSSDVYIADEIHLNQLTCIGGSRILMESASIETLNINGSTSISAGEDEVTVTKVNWNSGKAEMNGKINFGKSVNVSVNGNGEWICKENSDITINGNLDMSIRYDGQSIEVNCEKGSKLEITGDIIGHRRDGGFRGSWYPHIYLNGNIIVWGNIDFNAKEVYMEEESAYVIVYGNYNQQMGSFWGDMWGEDCLFTAGTLEVKGNYLYDSSGNSNFLTGTHTTIFSGDKKQTVYGILKNVEVKNTSEEGVEFQAISTTGFGGTTIHHTKIYGTLCIDKNSVIQGSSTKEMLYNKVTLLEITAAPDKMLYLPDEEITGKGMELQVTYQNGERRPTYGGWTIKTEMASDLGKVPVEIEFGGKTTPFEVISEEEGTLREGACITFNHHKYRLFAEYLPWDEVKQRCEELGGYLVSINSQEELQMVMDLVNKYSGLSDVEVLDAVWIGLFRGLDDSEWKWITDEALEFSNWNNEEELLKKDKTTAIVKNTGKWEPVYPGLAYPYICEWNGEEQKPSEADIIYSIELFYPRSVTVDYKTGIFSKDKNLPGIPSATESKREKEQYKNELQSWAKEFGYESLFTEKYLDMLIDGELTHSVMEVYPTENGMYKKENEDTSVAAYMRDIIFLSTLHNSIVDWNKSYVDKFDPDSYVAEKYKTKAEITLEKMREIHDRAFGIVERYTDYMDKSKHDPFNCILNTSFSAVDSLEELNKFHKAERIYEDIDGAIKKADELYKVVSAEGIEIPATITSINEYLNKGSKYLSYGNDLIKLYRLVDDKNPSMLKMLEFLKIAIAYFPLEKFISGGIVKQFKESMTNLLNMPINACMSGPFFMHMYLSQDENYIIKYMNIDENYNSSLDVMAMLMDTDWKNLPRRKTMQKVVQMAVDGLGLEGMPDNLTPGETEQVLYCVSIINAGEKFDSKEVRKQFIKHLAQIIEQHKKQENIPEEGMNYRLDVKCPVNIRIYQGNNCIGSIVDGKIENKANDQIWLSVYGKELDKKIVEFMAFNDFRIELEATGNGSMDLFIHQYDLLNVHQKTVGFQEVSLNAGKQMNLFLELDETFPEDLKLQIVDESRELTPTLFIKDKDWTEEPEEIEFLEDEIVLRKGEFYQIPRIIRPMIADEKHIKWKSSNLSCVSVDDVGNIMAKENGTAIISAYIGEDIFASIQVEVVQRLEGLEIIGDKDQLNIGEKLVLDVKTFPKDIDCEYEWISENPKIVSVDAFGNATAHADGTAIVKVCSAQDNRNAFLVLTVKSKETTTEPGENEKPGEEIKPGENEKPDGGVEPGENEEPSGGTEPGQGELPGDEEQPGESELPGENETPGEEESPGKDENPGEIEPPEEIKKPESNGNGGSYRRSSKFSVLRNGTQNESMMNLSYLYFGTWTKIGEKWKFILSDGSYARKSWIYDKGNWYVIGIDEFMLTGWQFIDGNWYYFNLDGSMAIGWIVDNNQKYYLNPVSDGTKGKMFTGWQFIDEKWYYFNEKSDGTRGALFTNCWIENDYVDADGVYVK